MTFIFFPFLRLFACHHRLWLMLLVLCIGVCSIAQANEAQLIGLVLEIEQNVKESESELESDYCLLSNTSKDISGGGGSPDESLNKFAQSPKVCPAQSLFVSQTEGFDRHDQKEKYAQYALQYTKTVVPLPLFLLYSTYKLGDC
jgi:hypothetical protein